MHNFLFIRLQYINNISDSKVDWLLVDHNGKVIELSSRSELLSDVLHRDLSNKKIILLIPDYSVSYNIADLPIKDRKKRLQAAGFALEDKIIPNVENTIFTVGPEVSKDKYLVAAVDKQIIVELLEELNSKYNIKPFRVLTDAICLYNNSNINNNYKIYLNQANNLGLVINNGIIITQLDTLDLIINQLADNAQSNLILDIYKHKINNLDITSGFLDKNSTKITIQAEQEITDWLSFLASSWLSNAFKNNNRDYYNFSLSGSLVKQESIDIKFDRLWFNLTVLWGIIFVGFLFYKYLDYNINNSRNDALNKLIKTSLVSAEIKPNSPDGVYNINNLNTAEQLLDRKISSLTDKIQQERLKNRFYVLLSAFVENFNSEIKINNIKFDNDILSIKFDLNKNDINYLSEIKKNLEKSNILLKENTKVSSNENYSAEWVLSYNNVQKTK